MELEFEDCFVYEDTIAEIEIGIHGYMTLLMHKCKIPNATLILNFYEKE